MELVRSTEKKKTKDKNCENVYHLEVNEAILVYCNLVNNNYQWDN